jgi:hypothetical protein
MSEIAFDGKKFVEVQGTFVNVDAPPKKEPAPVKIVEPEPKCWVVQHEVRIRKAKLEASEVAVDFAYRPPANWGCLSEMCIWGKEQALALNLPFIEIEPENPNLQSRDFEAPAVYLIRTRFDQFSDPSHRVFRY